MACSVLEVRLTLAANGYTPIPLHGKAPSLASWQTVQDVSREQAVMWEKSWPDARNTGVLTASMPTLDLDIMDAAAIEAIVLYVRDKFEERGYVPARVGRAPRTALPFRTLDPFAKYSVDLIAANGDTSQKVEFLAQGQQVVVDGIHPDTRQPYTWQGGSPLEIALEELAYISADGARQLLDEVVEILVRDFGYSRAKGRPRKTGNGGNAVGGTEDWGHLIDNIHAGRNLHASLRDLAAKLIRSGMKGGAAVNFLRSQLEGSTTPHDERWQDRYDNIPRLVDSAEQKYSPPMDDDATAEATTVPNLPAIAPAAGNAGAGGTPPPPLPPPGTGSPSSAAGSALSPIEETLQTFERWLHLPNRTPVYAMLGTVAANLLPGDPVWLGLVAPPSSAKTELLNALTGLPFVVSASTLTLASLLSGTPRRQQAQGARGGLLRQVANPGMLCLKDFTSTLTMRPESKGEVLSALREIYDGRWTRHLGTDGGRQLHWEGKLGLVFGCTGVIDSQYSISDALGNRFLLSRIEPAQNQFAWALKHTGVSFSTMRRELVDSVTQLFNVPRPDPQPLDKDSSEFRRLNRVVNLVVRLRGAIDRDRYSRELQAIYGVEGTGRIGLALERLLAGLDTLGLRRRIALGVVMRVALDSTPPVRRRIYQYLCKPFPGASPGAPLPKRSTTDVGNKLGLPTPTVRRSLEDLASYGLVREEGQGSGRASLWQAIVLP